MRAARAAAGVNMDVTVAKTAGFCFGVKRAVEKVYEQIEKGKTPIYTFGPIIHNEEVVRDLEERGVKVLETAEELRQLTDGVVVIRSHGVGKDIYDILEKNGIEIIDATCPFVKKIHRIVSEQNENGRRVIIVGNGKHPEVEGIKGWGNDDTLVIETAEEFEKLQQKGIIEVAPLAYMRGRTLEKAFVILDEAQNTTVEQIKMFLTRLGFRSKMVINGDVTQIDLPVHTKSGLVDVAEVLQDISGIQFIHFSENDVVRHDLVAAIIRAYEQRDNRIKK